jgi:4'-phosphopantetheinyl transferase
MEILYTHISENDHSFLIDNYADIDGIKYKEKIQRYRRWQDAQLSLLGRMLLKYGLNTYYEIKEYEIYFTPYNKPYLKNEDVYFNISHTENLVICAIARFPIGIDVEFSNPQIDYMDFQSHMTPNEFNKIDNSKNKIYSFYKYWTEKESVIKAHGKGLSIPLKSFEIINNECLIECNQFYLKEIYLDKGYVCSLASANNPIKKENIYIQQLNINIFK